MNGHNARVQTILNGP